MIEFKNISIGHKEILFQIPNLDLYKGFLYTLIGKNGSGKSTFFATLLQNISPINGEILIQNKKLNQLKNLELAKIITYVNSKFDGVQFLKVKDYIALGRVPHTNFLGKLNEEDYSIINETIKLLDLKKLENKYTLEISDGERQICSIAKALVQKTPIILLDEPAAFLDYSNRIKIIELMKRISKEFEVCIIQSSHDLELSMEYSDYFLLINQKDKLLEIFQNQEIDKKEILKKAFNLNLN